jgi:hypothetical protein
MVKTKRTAGTEVLTLDHVLVALEDVEKTLKSVRLVLASGKVKAAGRPKARLVGPSHDPFMARLGVSADAVCGVTRHCAEAALDTARSQLAR